MSEILPVKRSHNSLHWWKLSQSIHFHPVAYDSEISFLAMQVMKYHAKICGWQLSKKGIFALSAAKICQIIKILIEWPPVRCIEQSLKFSSKNIYLKGWKLIFLCIFLLIENANVSLKNLLLTITNPLHLTVGGMWGCPIHKTWLFGKFWPRKELWLTIFQKMFNLSRQPQEFVK